MGTYAVNAFGDVVDTTDDYRRLYAAKSTAALEPKEFEAAFQAHLKEINFRPLVVVFKGATGFPFGGAEVPVDLKDTVKGGDRVFVSTVVGDLTPGGTITVQNMLVPARR